MHTDIVNGVSLWFWVPQHMTIMFVCTGVGFSFSIDHNYSPIFAWTLVGCSFALRFSLFAHGHMDPCAHELGG
jgi:hypothetical protein